MTEEQKDWYSPSEIVYSRYHNFFILQHLEEMKVGNYPPEHKETGYYGGKKSGIKKHAKFEMACIFAAEIERRLKLTKTDGKLLKAQVQGGITDYELLEPESQMALDYVSIFDFRKRPKYSQWRKTRNYNLRKGRVKLRPKVAKRPYYKIERKIESELRHIL